MKHRHFLKWLIFLYFICTAIYAAPSFPVLTGRVVDNAHILSPATISQLDTILADYERGTTNQVVVLTLPSLQGYAIDDYGYQLGRYWQIGQKDKNNGVILIVAPTEKKVRIEVGYGLEPILTDALSSLIVQKIIISNFKAGHLEQGVVDGTKAIINVLGGKSIAIPSPTASKETTPHPWLVMIFIFLFLWFVIRHPFIAAIILSNSGSGSGGRFGGGGFGGGGGGFGGGGGSFGGGGSSGSW